MSEETKIEKLYAWHAVKAGGTTPYLTVAEVLGQKYTLADDKPIVPCKHGYHASVKAEDAAKYAYGLRLRRVLLEGEIVTHGYDKHAARSRTPLWEIPEDTTIKVLVEWSFWCVETVARPSLVSALRNAGLMDHAAQIDALPQITDSSSAGEFLTAADAAARAAARAARAAYAADAADAARAAARAAYAAAYAARAADACAADAYAAAYAAYAADAAAARAADAYAAAADAADTAAARAAAREKMSVELQRRLMDHAPEGYTEP